MILYTWGRPSGHLQISIIISTVQISTYGLKRRHVPNYIHYKIYSPSLKPKSQAIPYLICNNELSLKQYDWNESASKQRPHWNTDYSQGQKTIIVWDEFLSIHINNDPQLCPSTHTHGQQVCLELSHDSWLKSCSRSIYILWVWLISHESKLKEW